MSHYGHFTTEERELSRVMKAQGLNYTQIAEILGKDKSSVSREFARNSREDGTYSANHADKLYAERRKNCGRKLILEDEQAKNYVTEKLEQRWTPEQIAGRAKPEKQPFSISYPTIYRAIDSGILPKQLKKLCASNVSIKNAAARTDGEKFPIRYRSMNVPQAQRTVHDTDIGKAIPSSAKGAQAALPPMLSVKAVILLPLKFPTGRIKPLRSRLLRRSQRFPKS